MSKQNILENTFKKEALAYQRGRETNSKVEEKKELNLEWHLSKKIEM
jgi:hypothetical protein